MKIMQQKESIVIARTILKSIKFQVKISRRLH